VTNGPNDSDPIPSDAVEVMGAPISVGGSNEPMGPAPTEPPGESVAPKSERSAGAASDSVPASGASADPAQETTADPLEEAKAEATRFREQLLRTAADLDNYRKRSKREVADAELRGREQMLRDLLPVFDNLERATMHADSATDVQSLVDGIRMVMRQFSDALGKSGISRVESTGAAFDPAVHEAIQQIETAEFEAGRIALEIQAGYAMGKRLIRPALVAVAKAPSAPSAPPASSAAGAADSAKSDDESDETDQ